MVKCFQFRLDMVFFRWYGCWLSFILIFSLFKHSVIVNENLWTSIGKECDTKKRTTHCRLDMYVHVHVMFNTNFLIVEKLFSFLSSYFILRYFNLRKSRMQCDSIVSRTLEWVQKERGWMAIKSPKILYRLDDAKLLSID